MQQDFVLLQCPSTAQLYHLIQILHVGHRIKTLSTEQNLKFVTREKQVSIKAIMLNKYYFTL